MAYTGTVEIQAPLIPKNGLDFDLVSAHHVYVSDGEHLDEALDDIYRRLNSGGGGATIGDIKIMGSKGVDTMFDTAVDEANERIDFGENCAYMVGETLVVEGAVFGDTIIISL